MATNFCAQILDEKDSLIRNAVESIGLGSKGRLEFLYEKLESSIKFRLPENGLILGLPVESQGDTLREFGQRLPFPVISLEYQMSGPVGKDQTPAPRRVLLAWETGDGKLPIQVHTFLYFQSLKLWSPYMVGLALNPDEGYFHYTSLPEIDKWSGMDAELKAILDDMTGDAQPLTELLAALACTNVRIEDDDPPPEKLNKKRASRGKVPFFTYKTLTLDISGKAEGPALGGTHASPRVHLRRGHIRRLPKGPVWVNAAIVGDKSRGLVAKDYRVVA